MKRYQVNFFAAKLDLEALVRAIESKCELQFVETGLFDASEQPHALTLLDSKLGIATNGDNMQEVSYLVADRAESIQIRKVPQHGGGMKYAIDQQINPKSIAFRPGGVYNETGVIAGQVGTISEDPASLALFQLFSKEIRRQFKKIRSYYTGNEAEQLLDKGWRLTSNVRSPAIYDLKRE